MTYEELLDVKLAIEKLEHDMRRYNVDAHDYVTVEELVVAIQCIEKQIPKKPNVREQGSTTVARGFCTECLRTVFSFDSYCPTCGQAIDWSDEE